MLKSLCSKNVKFNFIYSNEKINKKVMFYENVLYCKIHIILIYKFLDIYSFYDKQIFEYVFLVSYKKFYEITEI